MPLFNENKFKLRKLNKIADKIEALAPKYSAMDDNTLVRGSQTANRSTIVFPTHTRW